MQNAVNLAMDHTAGMDAGFSPMRIGQAARQRVDVDVVAGVIWSNLLMAIHKPVTRSGRVCRPVAVGWQIHAAERPDGMGKYMQVQV